MLNKQIYATTTLTDLDWKFAKVAVNGT